MAFSGNFVLCNNKHWLINYSIIWWIFGNNRLGPTTTFTNYISRILGQKYLGVAIQYAKIIIGFIQWSHSVIKLPWLQNRSKSSCCVGTVNQTPCALSSYLFLFNTFSLWLQINWLFSILNRIKSKYGNRIFHIIWTSVRFLFSFVCLFSF